MQRLQDSTSASVIVPMQGNLYVRFEEPVTADQIRAAVEGIHSSMQVTPKTLAWAAVRR